MTSLVLFSPRKTGNLPALEERRYKSTLDNTEITKEDVKKKIQNLNPSKASGPDDISPRVLRELAEEIAKPVAMIMNMILRDGVPKDWKLARVSPTCIFKRRNKSQSQ